MNLRRPAIKMSHEDADQTLDSERDTLPPSGGRRALSLGEDETVGLVSVLFYAQQAAVEANAFISDAEDANDAELAHFLEDSRRESLARVEHAKRLLLARLQAEAGDANLREKGEAPHGRVHYVSAPDSDPSPFNTGY